MLSNSQIALLLALVFLRAPVMAWAAVPEACKLALTPKYVSQVDQRFEAAGLWYDGRSGLCGPTCLMNALNVARALKGLPAPDPVVEMASFISQLERHYQDANVPLDPRRGTSTSSMTYLIRNAFANSGIPVDVEGRNAISPFSNEPEGPVTWADFPGTQNGKEFTLIAVYGGPKEDGIGENLIFTPRLSHWMLVVASDPDGRSLKVIDPVTPDPALHAKLEPAEDLSFSVAFDRPLIGDVEKLIYFIGGVIRIRPKP